MLQLKPEKLRYFFSSTQKKDFNSINKWAIWFKLKFNKQSMPDCMRMNATRMPHSIALTGTKWKCSHCKSWNMVHKNEWNNRRKMFCRSIGKTRTLVQPMMLSLNEIYCFLLIKLTFNNYLPKISFHFATDTKMLRST